MGAIRVRGARTHNLKNIDVVIPRERFTVVTGPSGSGKSSLVFNTLYAEGQRRYVESLSAYARQFLSVMDKPDVDMIEGLSPAISIEQKSTSHNPRSTVGTITEIHDYLRLLFARVGVPHCPEHHQPLNAQTVSQMVDTILTLPTDMKIMILAPVVDQRKGEHAQLLEDLRRQGFVRARINGALVELDQPPKLDLRRKHTIEVVVDRLKVKLESRLRLAESLELALSLGESVVRVVSLDAAEQEWLFSSRFACPVCGYSVAELEPRLFSFNNPAGACPACDGLGVEQHFDPDLVVHDPDLSLAGGAVRGWDRRATYYFHLLTSLAEHYDFSVEKPFKKLPKAIRDMILYGNNERLTFKYKAESGRTHTRKQKFEGIIPNMVRRYHETESQHVREELAKYMVRRDCSVCGGARLCEAARNVYIGALTLPDITRMPITDAHAFFSTLTLSGQRAEIAAKIQKELVARAGFLVNVGLGYLTLARSADTLSGGEAQRIRLASQIGSGLVGVMYVLDEPSIGLHQRDNRRLLETLFHLRDLGNTVIVVEHDEEAILSADHVVDIGPGAGSEGGTVVAEGTPQQIKQTQGSLTGDYLSGRRAIDIPPRRTVAACRPMLDIQGARCNNLQNVDVSIPVGLLTCVTGVSGSGKSSLINDTLYPAVANALYGSSNRQPGEHDAMRGIDHFDKVIDINQSPIGRTPRSNPATYTGMFTAIRDLFAQTQEARSRGYKPGRFSFNVAGGRCEACQGDGLIRVEMHFLADVYVTCDTCHGQRYNRETLEVLYKGKNIHQVLNMTVAEGLEFFQAVPTIARKLQTLQDVGLSYVRLGQSATTLSGGEAQRVKLSKELSKRDTGRTLYILDEPTTGLHFHDVKQLLVVLHRLRDDGNTVVVIEHNLDVIKTADWIIDLGPEGGSGGGQVLVAGTPEKVAKCRASHTGQFLEPILQSPSTSVDEQSVDII